jgi:hypothetical protein
VGGNNLGGLEVPVIGNTDIIGIICVILVIGYGFVRWLTVGEGKD